MQGFKPLKYKGEFINGYMINSVGDIYSNKTNKILKDRINKCTGYRCIVISNGSRNNKMLIKIHMAVANTFIGDNNNNLVINHKDGNKLNCDVNNLEYVTHHENSLHSCRILHNGGGINIQNIETGKKFLSREAAEWCRLKTTCSFKEYFNKQKNRKTCGRHPITKQPLTWIKI